MLTWLCRVKYDDYRSPNKNMRSCVVVGCCRSSLGDLSSIPERSNFFLAHDGSFAEEKRRIGSDLVVRACCKRLVEWSLDFSFS